MGVQIGKGNRKGSGESKNGLGENLLLIGLCNGKVPTDDVLSSTIKKWPGNDARALVLE